MRKMNFRSLEYYLPVEIQSLPKHEIIALLETHSADSFNGTECIELSADEVASPNLFCHPKLVEAMLPFVAKLTLNEKDFIGNHVHILPQVQCDEFEKTRGRQQSIEKIFANRYSHNSIAIPWEREDIKVYLGPSESDILITVQVDGHEIPAACRHYGVERYVVPEFRGRGLGTELVLIGAKTPAIRGLEKGTGLYSPGGYASRKKAFDMLVQEFGLSDEQILESDGYPSFEDDIDRWSDRTLSGVEAIEHIVTDYLSDKLKDSKDREEIVDDIVDGIICHREPDNNDDYLSSNFLNKISSLPAEEKNHLRIDNGDGNLFYISTDIKEHPKLIELAICYHPELFQDIGADPTKTKKPEPSGPGF